MEKYFDERRYGLTLDFVRSLVLTDARKRRLGRGRMVCQEQGFFA
jgi:hypothetical protein